MVFGKSKKKAPEPTGYLGDMNDQQTLILKEFKDQIQTLGLSQNPWFDDQYLLRFCRARKFDMKKIIEMFTKFCEWRAAEGIDTIL